MADKPFKVVNGIGVPSKIWEDDDGGPSGLSRVTDDPWQELWDDCTSPQDVLQLHEDLKAAGLIE